MTGASNVKLLPLPEADGFMETFDTYGCPVGSEDAWGEETVKETIRANMKPLIAENERLVEALQLARDLVEDWAGYAGEYFQKKHNLEGDLALLDAALADQQGGES